MNTLFPDYLSPTYTFEFNCGSTPMNQNHDSNPLPPFPSPNPETPPCPAQSTLGLDPSATQLLEYINYMLMEEDAGEMNYIFQDRLALQAAENSLYQAIIVDLPSGKHCPPSVCENAAENLEVNFPGEHCPPSVRQNVKENPDVNFSDGRISNSISNFFGGDLNQENNLSTPRGRKNYERDVGDYIEEGRRKNKQPAISLDESELSGMFDDILLHDVDVNGESLKKRSTRSKKNSKKIEVVDLWTLLSQCAKAVYISDHKTATELLEQIRQHSSDSGDALQRLAHYFAIGLESRLAGKDAPAYLPMVNNHVTSADFLRAYKAYITACPIRKMSFIYANRSIMKVSEKATTLHIIDFGIQYGFQWPDFIQRLSVRPGGPPKLRITGIELPQPGFRPSERIEETEHRLRRFCARFNVPFEGNMITKKWETVQLEDIKFSKDEVLVVNCIYRSRHITGDTEEAISARDTVLKLINDIKPSLFVHGIINGASDNPFFLTRFKEALYHYSSIFDMCDATMSREDQPRILFEREVFGNDIINVVACEGIQRVERPETYKQWQARNLRAGLKQVGLDQELVKMVRAMVKSSYHRNFTVDVDGNWMLQGWKGRVFNALSCWKPT